MVLLKIPRCDIDGAVLKRPRRKEILEPRQLVSSLYPMLGLGAEDSYVFVTPLGIPTRTCVYEPVLNAPLVKRNLAEHKWNGLPACTRARCNRMAATAALRSTFARTGRKLSDSVFVVHKRLRSLRPIPLPASFILVVLQSPGCRTRGQAVSSQGQGGRWPKNYRCKTCNAASSARRGGGT